MVETVTAHYGWTKPEVTKSASTWGGFLNGDLDSIDALVFANQQGIVPIGGIQMFGGVAAPANWLLCDGASYSTAAPYDKLFAVLSTRFGGSGGSFNVPNLTQKFPLCAGPSNPVGQTGGSLSASIATANLPAHAHPIADITHTHGASASQVAHSHAIPNDVVVEGAGALTSGGTLFSLLSGQRTDSQTPGISVSIASSGTGLSTTQNIGSGTPLSVVPPYVAVYFIVRYL